MRYYINTKINNNKAFTLMELLVVVALISILSTISMAYFLSYKQRSYDAYATNDLSVLMKAEEAYFIDNSIYTTNLNLLPGLELSPNVSCSVPTATDEEFTAECYHPSGTESYCWDGSGEIRDEPGQATC